MGLSANLSLGASLGKWMFFAKETTVICFGPSSAVLRYHFIHILCSDTASFISLAATMGKGGKGGKDGKDGKVKGGKTGKGVTEGGKGGKDGKGVKGGKNGKGVMKCGKGGKDGKKGGKGGNDGKATSSSLAHSSSSSSSSTSSTSSPPCSPSSGLEWSPFDVFRTAHAAAMEHPSSPTVDLEESPSRSPEAGRQRTASPSSADDQPDDQPL